MRSTIRVLMAVLSLNTLVGSVLAQGTPPDLCALESNAFTAQGELYRYVWSGTFFQRSLLWGPIFPQALAYPEIGAVLDIDNQTILVKHNSNGVSILTAVSPAGVGTELFRDPFGPMSAWSLPTLDQTGDLIVTSWRTTPCQLIRMDRTGTIISTIARIPLGINPDALSIDLDTGDYFLLCHLSTPNGLRVTPAGIVTTLPGLENPPFTLWEQGLECDYRTGAYVAKNLVTLVPASWNRIHLAPSFRQEVLQYVGTYEFGGVALYKSDRVFGMRASGVTEVRATGGTATTYPVSPPHPLSFRGIHNAPVIVGSRRLAGRGAAIPGSEYELLLSFPGEGGNGYQVGASLSLRPGMTLPDGTYIPLSIDPLLLWSLSDPYNFRNFSGTLDALGRGTAWWRVPSVSAVRGIRVFFAALTFATGIRTVSNPIGVTVR